MNKGIITLFALLISIQIFSQDPNFHIYLCFGQSNMEGNASANGQPAADSRFKKMQTTTCDGRNQGQWYTANPPLARCGTGLGPADYFGRTLVENAPENVTIGVIVVAVGGSDIQLFEKERCQSYISSAPDWMVSALEAYGNNPYDRLIELAKVAQKDGVIKGILLHQGENNSGQQDWPERVKGIYDNMLKDLGLNAQNVPLLVGEMLYADQGGRCAGHNPIVNNVPNLIPTAHVVSASGLPGSDQYHFTADGYVEFGKRYANIMLDLITFETGVPIVKITSPTATDAFEAPASITITADATDEDGTITKVEFFNGEEKIGEASEAPYTVEWTDVSEGSYEISATATDNDQKTSSSSITIKVNVPQGPYNGTAHIIPGKIEFEEFDVGGNGSAYNDATKGTEVEDAPNYRTDEDVDIENCKDDGGGYNLGWTEVGEWTEYTVNVLMKGTYSMELRVACTGTEKTISVESNGNTIANDISIPSTGDWQDWETVVKEVELEAGEQVLRFTIGGDNYINMNYVEFLDFPCEVNPYPDVCSCDDLKVDSDNDGTPDCADLCPNDSNKTEPGECNCGTPEGECGSNDNNMKKGWNLVGYPYQGEVELETALQSIWDKVEVVKDIDSFYSKDANPDLNLLKTVKFGYGYLIRVSEPCSLKWEK